MTASAKLLVELALRSLIAHRVKSVIVGSLMLFGTALVVVGTSLLDSIEASMKKSIVSSLTGHLQVYDADAEDELQVFGGTGFGSSDIGEMPRFQEIERALLGVPNVAAVVPMAISNATLNGEGELDVALGELRRAVAEGREADRGALVARVRQLVDILVQERRLEETIAADTAERRAAKETLALAASEETWSRFQREPVAVLDWLDARVAPLAPEGQTGYLRYIGTDLDQFAASFDRFQVVDGRMVPTGHRGLLVSKQIYERYIKNPAARLFDEVHEEVVEDGKTIASDPLLREKVARMARQYQRILFQLGPDETAALEPRLRALLPGVEGDLGALIQELLRVDDATVRARYAFFYEHVAPKIDLYAFDVGDTIVLRSFTNSGFIRATSVKVWGTFEFQGLEKSELAGATSLADLMTFRDLYGQPTAETRAEHARMRAAVDAKPVTREDAEDALFGGDTASVVVEVERPEGFDEFRGEEALDVRDVAAATFDPAEQRKGLALSAAVLLRDEERLDETMRTIRDLSREEGLGIQAVDWRTASGIVGQFILVIRGVLYVAIVIIFLVAMVIINNSMVMATMDRVSEIGTIRALGAQRRFVLAMFLLETAVLGLVAGALGAATGAGIVAALGASGIPATSDVLVFLFAGPALHPTFGIDNLALGLVAILVVSLLATLYPARIATRIEPVVAMQAKE